MADDPKIVIDIVGGEDSGGNSSRGSTGPSNTGGSHTAADNSRTGDLSASGADLSRANTTANALPRTLGEALFGKPFIPRTGPAPGLPANGMNPASTLGGAMNPPTPPSPGNPGGPPGGSGGPGGGSGGPGGNPPPPGPPQPPPQPNPNPGPGPGGPPQPTPPNPGGPQPPPLPPQPPNPGGPPPLPKGWGRLFGELPGQVVAGVGAGISAVSAGTSAYRGDVTGTLGGIAGAAVGGALVGGPVGAAIGATVAVEFAALGYAAKKVKEAFEEIEEVAQRYRIYSGRIEGAFQQNDIRTMQNEMRRASEIEGPVARLLAQGGAIRESGAEIEHQIFRLLLRFEPVLMAGGKLLEGVQNMIATGIDKFGNLLDATLIPAINIFLRFVEDVYGVLAKLPFGGAWMETIRKELEKIRKAAEGGDEVSPPMTLWALANTGGANFPMPAAPGLPGGRGRGRGVR